MTPRHARKLIGWALALLLGGCAVGARPQAVAEASTVTQLDAAARVHPVAFLDRIGWGPDPAQLRQLQQVGATRLLEAQLQPDRHPALPISVAQSLAALPVNAPLVDWIPPLVAQRREIRLARGEAGAEDAGAAQARLKALQQHMNALTRQAMAQQLLLAVYGPNQLQQRLTWFWMNHFNVFRGFVIGPMLADYAQQVIAPNALGHFRDLLQATMFSPQMLLYLNNAQNARGHINENYAREVMELHTLGVGAGYTQADVTNLAHVLTGLGVDLLNRPVRVRPALRDRVWRKGLVVFNPARHDPAPEIVLGHTLQGRGVGEIEQVVTLLADDPATARHVSFELAQYFVSDHPDPAMVAAMVRTWRHTDGDIAAVLRTMYTSPQFVASLARPQFKDPTRYVISAVRASFDGRVIDNPVPILGMLAGLGEPLDGRTTPDGYPLDGDAWNSPGQLTTRFRIAQQLGSGAPALFAPPPPGLDSPAGAEAMLAPRRPPPELSRSAVFLAAESSLSRTTLQVLARAGSRVRWNALWLASPEFMSQ